MTNRPDPREVTIRLAALKALLDKVKGAYDDARRDALEALDPNDRKAAVLPSGAEIGTVTYVRGRVSPKVADRRALLAWVKQNAPSEVETVETVRESYIAALLGRAENVDGEAIDGKTGEVIPGLIFSSGDDYVRASQSDVQLNSFVQAYVRGEVATTLGSVIRAAIEPGAAA